MNKSMNFELVDVELYYNDKPTNKQNYLCAIGNYN